MPKTKLVPTKTNVTPLRALELFSEIPSPRYKTFRVTQDGAEPHLKLGEFAVIDTEDRRPDHGELFLIQYESGARRRRIVHVKRDMMNITGPDAEDSEVWWCGDIRGFRRTSGNVGGIPVFAGLSDGPYEKDHLSKKLLGRVVGVSMMAHKALLAPEAGWEDEEAGNAAFDAGEYIDAHEAAGYKVLVHINEDGRERYFEYMPERRQLRCERDAVMAAKTKYSKASLALDMIVAECLARGLVMDDREG